MDLSDIWIPVAFGSHWTPLAFGSQWRVDLNGFSHLDLRGSQYYQIHVRGCLWKGAWWQQRRAMPLGRGAGSSGLGCWSRRCVLYAVRGRTRYSTGCGSVQDCWAPVVIMILLREPHIKCLTRVLLSFCTRGQTAGAPMTPLKFRLSSPTRSPTVGVITTQMF